MTGLTILKAVNQKSKRDEVRAPVVPASLLFNRFLQVCTLRCLPWFGLLRSTQLARPNKQLEAWHDVAWLAAYFGSIAAIIEHRQVFAFIGIVVLVDWAAASFCEYCCNRRN